MTSRASKTLPPPTKVQFGGSPRAEGTRGNDKPSHALARAVVASAAVRSHVRLIHRHPLTDDAAIHHVVQDEPSGEARCARRVRVLVLSLVRVLVLDCTTVGSLGAHLSTCASRERSSAGSERAHTLPRAHAPSRWR